MAIRDANHQEPVPLATTKHISNIINTNGSNNNGNSSSNSNSGAHTNINISNNPNNSNNNMANGQEDAIVNESTTSPSSRSNEQPQQQQALKDVSVVVSAEQPEQPQLKPNDNGDSDFHNNHNSQSSADDMNMMTDSASDATLSVSSAGSSSSSSSSTKQHQRPAMMRRASNRDMDQFNIVFHKTLKEVEKIARLRVGDIVITPYGEGRLLELKESTKIALPWGILCTRLQNVHRKLPEQEFQEAMDHLNEIRKLHLAVECQKLNLPLQIDGCTACLLERPEYKVHRTQTQSKWNRFRRKVGESRKTKPTLWQCDVCGNPVCKYHDRQQQKGSGKSGSGNSGSSGSDHFHMCVDCAYDLNQVEHQLNPYHPNVLQTLERLLLLYTRMCLQLAFWLPYIPELCHQIFQKQRNKAKISLGTTGLGFVGAALGVASAATMLTPAGPAILIAAMATSATSGTLQATHQGYDKYFSSKVTHEIADRLIAWQGLCCGILQSLDQLRRDLLADHQNFAASSSTSATLANMRFKQRQHNSDLWSSLALGSLGVTRSAFTGVGVTASVGAGYAQVINSGLQTVPVVGAAFSVTYMAMDAGNIYNHLQQLSTPNSYIVRLKQLQNAQTNGGLPHISTVESEIDMLSQAIRDINVQIQQLRKEQDQTDQELKENNCSADGGVESNEDEEESWNPAPKAVEAQADSPMQIQMPTPTDQLHNNTQESTNEPKKVKEAATKASAPVPPPAEQEKEQQPMETNHDQIANEPQPAKEASTVEVANDAL